MGSGLATQVQKIKASFFYPQKFKFWMPTVGGFSAIEAAFQFLTTKI